MAPEPRTPEEANADNLRADIRKLMKARQVTSRGHIAETLNILLRKTCENVEEDSRENSHEVGDSDSW